LDGSFTCCNVNSEFEINNIVFDKLWFSVDGIYPELGDFVKTLDEAVGHACKIYAAWQEAALKVPDLGRAF
jgi:hypothetical protein